MKEGMCTAASRRRELQLNEKEEERSSPQRPSKQKRYWCSNVKLMVMVIDANGELNLVKLMVLEIKMMMLTDDG